LPWISRIAAFLVPLFPNEGRQESAKSFFGEIKKSEIGSVLTAGGRVADAPALLLLRDYRAAGRA
jgi:hypothetical protein